MNVSAPSLVKDGHDVMSLSSVVDYNATSQVTVFPTPTMTSYVYLQVFAEPTPKWDTAIYAWGAFWQLHTYVFGLCFVGIAAIMLITVFKLYSKCTNHKYVVCLNSMLLICGMCRGLYLIIDPYGSRLVLPVTFSFVLFGIGQPCLTSAFSLLQWAFMRVTQVKLGPCEFPSYRALSVFIVFHFLLVISVDLLVAMFPPLRLLLVLTETLFILWGFVLCGIFVFKGFKITQFTSETQKALKQLSKYNQYKHETEEKRKELRVRRVKRPRIRVTNDDDDTYSLPTDTTSGCSDSSDSCRMTHMGGHERKPHVKPRLDVGARDEVAEETTLLPAPTNGDVRNNNLEVIMTHDTITVLETYGRHDSAASSLNGGANDLRPFCDLAVTDTERSSLGSGSGSGSVFTVDDFAQQCNRLRRCDESYNGSGTCPGDSPPPPVLPIRDERVDSGEDDDDDEEGEVLIHGYSDSTNAFEMKRTDDDEPRDSMFEMGYMADTEPGSPARKLDNASDESRYWPDQAKTLMSPDPSYATISFHRIRQGRVLHKLVKVTYLTTMFQFVLCILQLYAMFGIYGVLAKQHRVEPWPWLTFHSCFR